MDAKRATAAAGVVWNALRDRLVETLGGTLRTRIVLVLALVLGLSGADVSTVGASATELRRGLGITNTDIGLLVATPALVGALASLPFGMLADRVNRTRTLGLAIVLWGGAMIWSAAATDFTHLLISRLALGAVTAAAGPVVASLVGDYFGAEERGRIYGFVLTGELLGSGFGFAVTGDVAAASWRAAFVVLALPAFVLAWFVTRLPEPARGSHTEVPVAEPGAAAAAHRLSRERAVEPDPELVLHGDIGRMSLAAAVRHVLRVRTNLILIAASACGYYFLAGVQTFGVEFAKEQYGLDQALANVVLLIVGAGAVVGVLAGGALGDALLRRRHLNARVYVGAGAAAATTILFAPPLFTRSAVTAVPYLMGAACALSAQNPPLDAARLDVMPSRLWGRAEGLRTFVRTLAEAGAPLLFGVLADTLGGSSTHNHATGVMWAFLIMLVPLALNGLILLRALTSYPRDVATAAESERRIRAARSRN